MLPTWVEAKQVQRIVVAAHADEDAVQLGFGNGQLGGDHGVLGQPLHLFGNADVALCAGDGGDVPGPASERRGDQLVADAAYGDAYVFLDARAGGDGAGQFHGNDGFGGRFAVREP